MDISKALSEILPISHDEDFWQKVDAIEQEFKRLQAVEEQMKQWKERQTFHWEGEHFVGFGYYDSAYATYLVWDYVEQDFVLDYILPFAEEHPGERDDLWYIELGAILEHHITYGQVFPEGADDKCDPSEFVQELAAATLKQVKWSELARKWTENLTNHDEA